MFSRIHPHTALAASVWPAAANVHGAR